MADEGIEWEPDPEVVVQIRSRNLEYPIANKADFVASMSRLGHPIRFRGQVYDAGYGANLVPDFFFPVTSEHDLLAKVSELLMSRGLLPLRPRA